MLEPVIRALHDLSGYDFSAYKPDFLGRQVDDRCRALGVRSYEAYARALRARAGEWQRLFDALLNGYTAFFRAPLNFELLHAVVLPQMVARKTAAGDRTFRAWSAGCATGEEAYSLAILLRQHLPDESPPWALHLFATDIHERFLALARRGEYAPERLHGVKYGWLLACFEQQREGFRVRSSLRDMVTFSVHNLLDRTRRAPSESIFGSFDLVCCCNVALYFQEHVREQVLKNLLRSLVPDGILILGDTEDLPAACASQARRVSDCCAVYRKQ